MASKPNNWSGWSNTRSLNANTEAVAKAIWDEISTKNSKAMEKEPNYLKHLWVLKNRVNKNAKSNTLIKYYKLNAPKTGGFLSGLKEMFSSKTAAKPTVPNNNGNTKPNAFKVKPNAKPRRFSFFRRFGQRKTPPSAVTKNAVKQANANAAKAVASEAKAVANAARKKANAETAKIAAKKAQIEEFIIKNLWKQTTGRIPKGAKNWKANVNINVFKTKINTNLQRRGLTKNNISKNLILNAIAGGKIGKKFLSGQPNWNLNQRRNYALTALELSKN